MRSVAPFLILTVGLLVVWQSLNPFPKYVLPKPADIVLEANKTFPNLIGHGWETLLASITGLGLAVIIGVSSGVLVALSSTARRASLPYIIGSNVVPIVAVAPLLTLWLGQGLAAKAVVAAFLSFYPLTIGTYKGISEVEDVTKDLFGTYGASKWQYFRLYQLPHAFPYVITALKLSATYAVTGAVVAEFVSPQKGLGFGMLQASYNLNTPRLFVYMIAACLLGVVMYLMAFLVELFLNPRRWQREIK